MYKRLWVHISVLGLRKYYMYGNVSVSGQSYKRPTVDLPIIRFDDVFDLILFTELFANF